MASLTQIRNEIARRLCSKPTGLSAKELKDILDMLIDNITTEEEIRFTRLNFWLNQDELSSKLVCANVELVRFGVLIARPDRETKKSQKTKSKNSEVSFLLSFENSQKTKSKNSGVSFPPSSENSQIAHLKDLNTFLESRSFYEQDPPMIINQRRDTVEKQANAIDKWCSDQVDTKRSIDLPILDTIIEDENKGNNRTIGMRYISVENLVECIAQSSNASSLKTYAMQVSSTLMIYNKELVKVLKTGIIARDDKIDELKQMLEQQHKENQDHHQRSEKLLNDTKRAANNAEQAAVDAKHESIRSRELLEDLTDAVDTIHINHTETAFHSTPIVSNNDQTYFALTISSVDNNGTTEFRAWRSQKSRIFKDLSKTMVDNNHDLVIPPIYVAGAVNVAISAMNKVRAQIAEIAQDHNHSKRKSDPRWSMTRLINESGLKLKRVKPLWIVNDHITIKDMIQAYIDVIKESQGRSFHIPDMSDEFRQIVTDRENEYDQRIANSNGEAREHLKEMIEAIRNARDHFT